jgi:hypothetical protein
MDAEVRTTDVAPSPAAATAKHGKRLSTQQIAAILTLASAGKNNSEIARTVGCDDATVGYHLEKFGDARELARKRLEGGALKLAATVVNTKDAGIALKALGKLDVVREDSGGAGTNVLIAIGQPGQPLAPPALGDALSPSVSPVIHSLTVDSEAV